MKRLRARAGAARAVRLAAALTGLALAGCGSDDSPADAPAAAPVAGSAAGAPAEAVVAPPPAREVSGDMLAYAEVDGVLARGYFAYPSDMIQPLPAAILIHDWFGLDDEMRAVADRVAGQGYIVLAVDLFDGRTATKPVDARGMLQKLVEAPDTARENIRQARTFLKESVGAPRLAVMGWGSGGLWSLNTALMFPEEVVALVVVQGQTLTDTERLGTLRMPILGIFGAADRDIPPDSVRAFGETLVSLDIPNEIRLYPTAGRGFMLPGSQTYSPQQAENAWQLIVEFLAANLARERR